MNVNILQTLAPLIINAAQEIADRIIDGEKLTPDAIKGLKAGYFLGKLYLQDVVNKTVTTIDNEGLESFFELVEDIFKEANVTIPVV
jgi:hypothetical protein